jgi:hypothetical protein
MAANPAGDGTAIRLEILAGKLRILVSELT